jgi:hypothetical protein
MVRSLPFTLIIFRAALMRFCSTDAAYPYCYLKVFELSAYLNPFYEVDCAAEPGTLTVYQSYTNAATQNPDITPQLLVVTTTPSAPSTPSTTTSQAAASGGTIVNCGGGGGGNTCNVGSGNNGNGVNSGPRFSILDSNLLIHTFAFWIVTELFVFVFS